MGTFFYETGKGTIILIVIWSTEIEQTALRSFIGFLLSIAIIIDISRGFIFFICLLSDFLSALYTLYIDSLLVYF